jgi:hypothetical protein
MAPRGYTLNKRTGKFQAPKAGSGTNNKTMAARNKTTALKRGKTAARRGK